MIVNSSRIAIAPVLAFIYLFLAPLGIYSAIHRLWPVGNTLALSRLIVGLGIVQLLVVGLVDVPRFASTRNPDEISGTFGTNPYQLVFFLFVFVSLLVGLAVFEPRRPAARFAPILIVASFVTILLAQYRSLLVGTAVAMIAVAVLIGRWIRGTTVIAVIVIAFAGTFYYVEKKLPELKLELAASSLATSPGTYVSGRLGVFENVFRLYTDIPSTMVVGSGPGTYSSRAWQTFATADSPSQSNVAGGYARRFTGGQVYTSDVSEKYVAPQIAGPIVQGSHAVSSPYSSYASLLAEIGLIGFALICIVYFRAFGRSWQIARGPSSAPARSDALPAVALATTIAFLTLLQLAVLENWLEVTRATFLAWAFLAIASKEFEAKTPHA